MAKSKPVGWFKDPKVWNSNFMHVKDIFKAEDEALPIIGNEINRATLFKILWSCLAEKLSRKLKFQSKDAEVFQMICILMPLTQIIAYPLSAKKISGLGATSKANESIEFKDKVLKILLKVKQELELIRVTKTHKKYYPPVNNIIEEIYAFHINAVKKYTWAYKRDERFLQVCGESIDQLKFSGLKEFEIKQIVKEALQYFEDKGFIIYVKSLDRIFHKDFYRTVHSPVFLEDNTDVSTYYIEKVSKKKKK